MGGTMGMISRMRRSSIVLGTFNFFILLIGSFLISQTHRFCDSHFVFPFVPVSVFALVRIVVMLQTAIAQEATAKVILESPSHPVDAVQRLQRRVRYLKWLWWSRCTVAIIVLQFLCAAYLIFKYADYFSNRCVLEMKLNSAWWMPKLLSVFMIMVFFVALVQCFTGSDVLRWRYYYETHDNAWKCHYMEVFDHGIRETLCCLGRVKYLSALEEDEVYSVARLLGDLVAYRASGTGHMELLAGLALLQSQAKSSESYEEYTEAPEMRIREAAALHKFAEAAYTGPLLDFGRNPFIFPCAWLYRQGILSPWTRNRRPALDGDNWWRGHAAAFLKYVDLPPEVLRHGRVSQVKCEAAYFIVVLHHLQTVVIAIRGTETPEDLITDGLCKECTLCEEDLSGLISCSYIHSEVKNNVSLSFPHHGHSGIVGAARELYMQIEGNPEENDSESNGLLSKLLGVGYECFGYNLRIVGHSLGGAIAALLGLRLYNRYPNLHVYSYGPLPCVDFVVANACSEFVTSIIFGNEFSSRLSIGSVMRLRAAAITSLSQDPKADGAMIFKLARRCLTISKYQRNKVEADESDYYSGAIDREDLNHQISRSQHETDNKGSNKQDIQEVSLWTETAADSSGYAHSFSSDGNHDHEEYSLWTDTTARDHIVEIDNAAFTNPFGPSIDDPVSQFIDTVPDSENQSDGDPPDMYLPGLVIHIVHEQKKSQAALTSWRLQERGKCYRAYIAKRENFKDIVVSPSMFLDHLPWRCHYALQKILKAQSAKD
ncbi:unnamed protein product [Lupinus luteus]|uniref:Fungal lipase-like domain-containing protein n=1 Tax=Lupinus luteus TaxID=3873 RepID=A0AAV1X3U9_LUPLU